MKHPCPFPRKFWWRHGRSWLCSCGKEYWLVEDARQIWMDWESEWVWISLERDNMGVLLSGSGENVTGVFENKAD